jgi:periplasmic protein TonB
MRSCFIILFFLALTPALGQKPRKMVVETTRPPIRETFYVLEDKKHAPVKHGPYARDYGDRLKEYGQYENGRRAGIWEVKALGEVIQRIDFSIDSILLTEPMKNIEILSTDSIQKNATVRAPLFLGGSPKFQYYLEKILRYPKDALRGGIEGIVWIRATVTKDGRLIDESIDTGIGGGAEEEALRLIQTLPDDWIPMKIDGLPVDVQIRIWIRFILG